MHLNSLKIREIKIRLPEYRIPTLAQPSHLPAQSPSNLTLIACSSEGICRSHLRTLPILDEARETHIPRGTSSKKGSGPKGRIKGRRVSEYYLILHSTHHCRSQIPTEDLIGINVAQEGRCLLLDTSWRRQDANLQRIVSALAFGRLGTWLPAKPGMV